jgi:putative transcriptional regulator
MTVSESVLSSSPAQHHFVEMISTYNQYGGHNMVTNNISEIRKEKHLIQDDLAVALGVCRKSIFNIEHNNVIPNIDTCLSLAKYLDMTVEDLFEIQDA